MKPISNSSQLKTCKIDKEDYVILELDINNISKIPLQIIYYKEYGHKNFLISYNLDKLKIPVTKVLAKLKIDYLLKLTKEYDFKFKFEGFPRCVYERNILRPGLRWYYEDKVGFKKTSDSGSDNEKLENCELCLFNKNCSGVCKDYISKFTEKEFQPLISNKELYDLNVSEVEIFSNKELIKIGKELLRDYKKDKYYLRKRFVFVSSFPRNLEDSSKERFVYYIYNRRDDFEKTFELLLKYFDNHFLNSIKNYLEISNQLVLSFGLMGDDNLRKTFYFSIEDLNINQINEVAKLFNLEVKPNRSPAGIGIDFKGDKVGFKMYYSQNKISVMELKSFVKDIALENKRSFLKFSNSLIKPLNSVLLDYKYKDGKLYSKRVDISMQYNVYRLNQFYALFQIPLSFFENKEIYTLSFEMRNGDPEKINFYYALTIPEDEEEMDEGEF